jgi:hypothetical protein
MDSASITSTATPKTSRKQARIRARAAELVDIERQAKALAAKQLAAEAAVVVPKHSGRPGPRPCKSRSRSRSRSCSPPPQRRRRCCAEYGYTNRPWIPGGFINAGLIGSGCDYYGPPVYTPYYRTVSASVAATPVCGPRGCSLITQPTLTTCGPLGCTTAFGPPNLAGIVDGYPARYF